MLRAKQPCLLCNPCAAIFLLTARSPLLPRACKWTRGRSFFLLQIGPVVGLSSFPTSPTLFHMVPWFLLSINSRGCSHARTQLLWHAGHGPPLSFFNLPYPPGRSRVSATLSSGGHGSHTVTCPILPISCACSNPIAQLKHLCAMCKMLMER